MITRFQTTLALMLGLIGFWGISLVNVLKHKGTTNPPSNDSPMSLSFALALIGSLLLFAESLVYIYTGVTGTNVSFGKLYSPTTFHRILGITFFITGTGLHIWSVVVRGRYAVSWAMSKDHKLIKTPPYNLVRHPSYLGYILMIIGVSLLWGNLVTFVPWIAIPGYLKVSRREENLLISQFGDDYVQYMAEVGGFIPNLGKLWETRSKTR